MATDYQTYLSGPISCTVGADLMTNYIAGSSIDARYQIDVVQDAGGDPILFSISSPMPTGTETDAPAVNQLFATLHDPATPTGWQQVNISPRNDRSVQAFGVVQDPRTNKIVLAVAIDDGAGASELYLTAALSAYTTQTDWAQVAAGWVARPGAPAGGVVTKLVLGSNSAISAVPLVIASVQVGGAVHNYFIQGDPAKTDCHLFDPNASTCWWPYQLPEGATTLTDLVIGTMYLDQAYRLGTYALYQIGQEEHLMFSSVPDSYYLSHYRKLTAPAGAVALQTVPDPDPAWQGCSTLYVGGNGLSSFEAAAQSADNATATVVSADAVFGSTTELLVRADSQHVSVWAKNHNQVLYYLRGDQASTARNWTAPLSLRQNVARIAALRNQPRAANEVFAVGSDNKVAYLWQDSATTQWKESDLPLPALDTVQQFPCFTTVFTFTDANHNPAADQAVALTASEWTYATVNGYLKVLEPDDAIVMKTDSLGRLTIINKVSTVTTPIFRATADFLTEPVMANPAANVLAGLGKVQTGQDLLDATTQEGQPVVTGEARNDPDGLDAVASGIQELLPLLDALPADGSTYSDTAAQQTAFMARPGGVWGLKVAGARLRFHTGTDVSTHLLPDLQRAGAAMMRRQGGPPTVQLSVMGGVVDAVESVAGDVLEAMWNGVEKISQILIDTATKVVNGVAQVIVYIGEQVVSFVVQTIADILSLIGWILHAIAVTLETLIKWLGFLFSWDDILNTHEVISKMTTETLNYFGAQTEGAADRVRVYFDKLILKVKTLPALQVPGEQDVNLFTVSANATAQSSPQHLQMGSQASNGAGGSFAYYQLMHGGIMTGTAPDENGSSGPIEAFFKEVLMPTLDDFFDAFRDTIGDLMDLVRNNELTVGNLLKVFTADFLVGILTAVRDILAGLLDVVAETIEWINDLLNANLPIPFLSGLYSLVTKGSAFTLLDCFALFFAIPTTIGYKIVMGKAPFTDEQVSWLKEQTYETLFPASLLPQGAAKQAAPLMLVTMDEVWQGLKVVYSQIGGGVYFVSDVIGVILYQAKASLSGQVKFLDKLDAICSTIYFVTSFPIREDDKEGEQVLDLPVWFGEFAMLALKVYLAKTSRVAFAVKEGEATAEDACGALMGLMDCACYILSTILVKDQDMWDYIMDGQNLCSGMGSVVASVAAFGIETSELTGQLEITAVAEFGFGIGILLKAISATAGGVRLLETLITDEEKVFYIM
jgi:hypothetical protein